MIEILIGNIASGKSTYAKKRAAQGAVVVNDDAIVTAVHGGDYLLYSVALKSLYKAVGNQIFATAIALGRDVVIDKAHNVKRSSRQLWLSLAKQFDQNTRAVIFDFSTPDEHARRRCLSDDRGYSFDQWLAVARRFCGSYEPVDAAAEGFESVVQA